MAQNKKGKLFYEITREKPVGKSHISLIGGSMGSAVSFFMVSVLGSLYGVGMDDLVFYFIMASIIGFFVGGFLTWIFIQNFSKVLSLSTMGTSENIEVKPEGPLEPAPATEGEVPVEEDKGQSVDFVFPELSPDK